jgi:hypothetical protein
MKIDPKVDSDADVAQGASEQDPGERVDTGGYALSAQETKFLDAAFTYHPPGEGDPERYVAIRTAARHLAETIILQAPACADRTVALRKVREAVMTANAAVALKGFI